MAEIFKQKQTGINIESIDDEIDYRTILLILTANGFAHENFQDLCQILLNELKEFVESLIIMYMGIEYKWEMYLIDDMISTFEDNFNLQWEKIRFRE